MNVYTPFSRTETEGVREVVGEESGEAEAAVLAGGGVGGVGEESGKSSLERGVGAVTAVAVVAGSTVGTSVGGPEVESGEEGVRSGPKPEKTSGGGV